MRDALPTTHATYLPDRHMFALWTWTGQRPGPAPSGPGEPDRIALAIPSATGNIAVTQVACTLVEPDQLTTARRTPSVRAWRAALDGRADANELHGLQIGWCADQSASFQEYMRRTRPDFTTSGSWPER